LIFDDDALFAGLLSEILRDQGMTVKYFPDGIGALENVRREKPGIILTDVMMPGLDGISLCSQIKVDPQFSWIKVVVISGKHFPQDKARAAKAQADLFVEKPFNVADFSSHIHSLMPTPGGAGSDAPGWTLRLWGNHGDVGCSSFIDRHRLFVLEAGGGLESLAAAPIDPGVEEVWVLLSHLSAEHVCALRHAECWPRLGLPLHVLGPFDSDAPLGNLIRREIPSLPVAAHPLLEGEFDGIVGVRLRTLYTMHPGPCLAYRIESHGLRIAFIPDNEIGPDWETQITDYGEKLISFAKGVDLLVHDGRYLGADYANFAGQGHSPAKAALRLALRARARRLLLYHVDARYDTQKRLDLLSEIQSEASTEMAPPVCWLPSAGAGLSV
jgi:CheY-like chemotaxis protein